LESIVKLTNHFDAPPSVGAAIEGDPYTKDGADIEALRREALKANSGDIITLVTLVTDNFARVHKAKLHIDTRHEKDCGISKYMPKAGPSNEELAGGSIDCRGLTEKEFSEEIEEILEPLYACDCDVSIEALLQREDGDTLLLLFNLREMKSEIPWLNDQETIKDMLEAAKKLGVTNRLMRDIQPLFKNLRSFGAAPEPSKSGVRGRRRHNGPVPIDA